MATSVGAIAGTSNVTTYVESAAGIGAGGRTGLTALVVGICFALSSFLAHSSDCSDSCNSTNFDHRRNHDAFNLKNIPWDDMAEAVPAFFTSIFMDSATLSHKGLLLVS